MGVICRLADGGLNGTEWKEAGKKQAVWGAEKRGFRGGVAEALEKGGGFMCWWLF